MSDQNTYVCPAALAGSLDNRFRRLVHNPQKILAPYVQEGMTVLDIGCGPGFFTIGLAGLVGKTGRVVAADLQSDMLAKVEKKIKGTDLENIIVLHNCRQDRIGLVDSFDFILAFYMVHEVPDQQRFFTEIATLLKPQGRFYIMEPPFHVTKKAFLQTVEKARLAGLAPVRKPVIGFDKSVLLQRTA
jgi:ubiquinone/menaquinone biosynthesis C-methylase UbiE